VVGFVFSNSLRNNHCPHRIGFEKTKLASLAIVGEINEVLGLQPWGLISAAVRR
jgi:hypothetical protein